MPDRAVTRRWRTAFDPRGDTLPPMAAALMRRGSEHGDPVVWRSYMFEAVGGTVPPGGVLLSTEGAKVCIPMLVVVPPASGGDGAFVGMFHFGVFEPHLATGAAPLHSPENRATYLASFSNAAAFLGDAVIKPAVCLARLRGVRAVLYVTLGKEMELSPIVEWLCNTVVADAGESIRVVYDASYKRVDNHHVGIMHARVSRAGYVDMDVGAFDRTTPRGYVGYHTLSINTPPKKAWRGDGCVTPHMYDMPTACTRACVQLPPEEQVFELFDMDDADEAAVDRRRAAFAADLARRAGGQPAPTPPCGARSAATMPG